MLVQTAGSSEAHLLERFRTDMLVGRHKLRHPVESGLRKPKSLADIA